MNRNSKSSVQVIGSLHEISISFKHTWLESVFYADSHGIFYFFFKSIEVCVFLVQSSNKRLPFQNGVSAIFDGRCLICDEFVDDAHQNHQNHPFRTAYGC